MPVTIRLMTTADVAPAAAAVLRGDWGERSAWFAFAAEHPSCDALVAVEGDEIVGTGVGTRHGRVGWVGTIYVVPERRGEGLGHEMSRFVVDGLEAAGCRTLVLTATPAGRPIYERLGFAASDTYVVLEHPGVAGDTEVPPGTPAPSETGVRPFTRADLPDALALDRAATGEDRSAVLAAMVDVPGGLAVRADDGPLRAFLLRGAWPGGATIAPDPADALGIARARLAAHPGGRVVTGLLASNTGGLERFAAEGWTEIRRIVRMQRGDPLDWRPDWIYGQLNFALG